MPLSEHEQRVLEEMERALTSDDPRLATTLQAPSHSGRSGSRYAVAGIGLVVGLIVLIVGAVGSNVVLGVVGFVVMFAGVAWAFAFAPRGRTGPEGTVQNDGTVRPSQGAKRRAKKTFMSKVEDRWDRRRERGH